VNTYLFDPENAVEMARLLNQHTFLSRAMSGVLPTLSPAQTTRIRDVLDLACGPGGWVLDVARALPHAFVLGVDVSAIMVAYGRVELQRLGIQNARFLTMDIHAPLQFPDKNFDLVHGRLLSSLLKRDEWPSLLQEVFRICRVGGTLLLTEIELPVTTSPALTQLYQLLARAYQQTSRSFTTSGSTFAIIANLSSLLQNAGFHNIQERTYTLDFSTNTPLHTAFYQSTLSFFQLIEPFFTGLSLITTTEYQRLYQQMSSETWDISFRATGSLLSAWGER
jgi:ubiquinone/menaquinone biosynthesis C-methylase UbiE